jgi:Trypsin-like peptidase domain
MSSESLELSNSVIQITSTDVENKASGTGFLIHKDEDKKYTYLLTCAHVIEDVGGKECVAIGELKAKVVAMGEESWKDLAVLKVEGILKNAILELGTLYLENRVLVTGGYRPVSKASVYRECEVKLKGSMKKQPKLSKGINSIQAFDIQIMESDGMIEEGCSGSPIVDKKSKQVIGILSIKDKGNNYIALSTEVLADV